MPPDPSTPSSPAPGRWRRLFGALGQALGPADAKCSGAIAHMAVVAASPSEGRRLHICTACGADVVNPAQAEPLDEERWTMLLRCGACGATVQRIVSNAAARCYDDELDRGYGQIARAIDRIDREGMEEWADTFTAALGRDLIAPDDFAHHLH